MSTTQTERPTEGPDYHPGYGARPNWHRAATRRQRCLLKRASLASAAIHLRQAADQLDKWAALGDRALDTPTDEYAWLTLVGTPTAYVERSLEMMAWFDPDTLPSVNTMQESTRAWEQRRQSLGELSDGRLRPVRGGA